MGRDIGEVVNPGAGTTGRGPAVAPPVSSSQSFSKWQITAVILIGVIGSLVGALQPLLLGPLAQEGRLSIQEMGETAMLEALGMALAIAVSGALLKPRQLRATILGAALVSLLANVGTIFAGHDAVLAARFVNGACGGVMLWVWTGLLTHIELPARLVAIFVSIQSLLVLAMSSVFSSFVTPLWGASGGYGCLALASVVIGLLSFAAPNEYKVPARATGAKFQLPSARGFIGLIAVTMHLAAIMSIWVYVLPLGKQLGLAPAFIALTVSIALAGQIAGGLSGAVFARLNARVALYISIAVSVIALSLLKLDGGVQITFIACLTAVSFFWMFAPGFQMPYLIEIDPSRRAGMQMITAQLLGLSIGPEIASLAVRNGDVTPALLVSLVLFLGSAVLVFATTTIGRSKP